MKFILKLSLPMAVLMIIASIGFALLARHFLDGVEGLEDGKRANFLEGFISALMVIVTFTAGIVRLLVGKSH